MTCLVSESVSECACVCTDCRGECVVCACVRACACVCPTIMYV
jgi:hypothetical protein